MFSFRSWAKNLNVILYRFVSDGTIEYSGFKAVYQFIPNPLETLPFIPKCEFEVGGSTGFIGKYINVYIIGSTGFIGKYIKVYIIGSTGFIGKYINVYIIGSTGFIGK